MGYLVRKVIRWRQYLYALLASLMVAVGLVGLASFLVILSFCGIT